MQEDKPLTEYTTDELLELLPNNLYIARNSYAIDQDKYRLFNSHTQICNPPGFSTVRELLIHHIEASRKELDEWVNDYFL